MLLLLVIFLCLLSFGSWIAALLYEPHCKHCVHHVELCVWLMSECLCGEY